MVTTDQMNNTFEHDLAGKPVSTLRQRGPPGPDHASAAPWPQLVTASISEEEPAITPDL
jgi:hypothetical protein